MPDTRLILHVKGTEQETTTLPKQVVRAAISQGQITHSQLIWVPEDNAWKQVRQLPHLLPSQKLAPAPAPRVPTGPLPKAAAVQVPKVASGTIPRVAKASTPIPQVVKAASASPTPRVAATAATAPSAKGSKSYVVKEENQGAHPLKWVSIGLGAIILGLVAVNYFLVDRALVSSMGQTSFANATVYAHLGAYVQPNVIVIHVPSAPGVTNANLTDFLVALAHSTPTVPLSDNLYARVALTSGWTANYSLTGYAWKQLGDMGKDDETVRKEFLFTELRDAAGEPLLSTTNKDEATLQANRDKVWNTFAAQFVRP